MSQEKYTSIQEEITEIENNLCLIQKRKSQYVEQTSIPLNLEKDEKRLQRRLSELKKLSQKIKKSRPIPLLLPYLCDRSEQEEHLDQAFQKLNQQPHRPLVCIIHGDDFQSHEMFLERLKQISLPKLIYPNGKGNAVTDYLLSWPSRLQKIDDLHNILEKKLADRLLNHSFVPKEKINKRLAEYPGPVIIHTHFLTEDWHQHASKVIESFIKFWQHWPDLAPGKHLFIFLFIKYQVKKELSIKRFCLKFKNKIIKNFIFELSRKNFSKNDRLIGTVLPKLDGIKRGEAEDWARDEARDFLCGERIEDSKIRDIFEQWEKENSSNTIPMEHLARKLTQILQNCSIAQEERG